MNPDFLDIIRALLDAEVRFIIENKPATGRPKDFANFDALNRETGE